MVRHDRATSSNYRKKAAPKSPPRNSHKIKTFGPSETRRNMETLIEDIRAPKGSVIGHIAYPQADSAEVAPRNDMEASVLNHAKHDHVGKRPLLYLIYR